MLTERIVKGIWVPIEIWEAQDLSWNEKILLMEIDSYTSSDKDCFMSDEYIADLLGTSVRSASRMMSNLIDKGYVERTRFDGRRRFVASRVGGAGTPNLAEQVRQNWRTTNNKIIDIDKSISDNIDKGSSAKKKFDFKQALIAIGVTEQTATDWMAVRKAKGAANTETAFKGIHREILASGATAEECILLSVENSWRGFKAEWMANQQRSQAPRPGQPMPARPGGKVSVLENNMSVAEQLARMNLDL